jgi:hypothetical protein
MPETTAPAERMIQLTETQLKALLAEAASGAGVLPPGAFRENGRAWRHVWVPVQGTDPKTGQPRTGRRQVKRPVFITSDLSPEGLLAAKRAAYRAAPPMDFWHPDHGWLRNGSKREVDHPSNVGAESDTSDVVFDDDVAPVETEQPAPPAPPEVPDPEPAPEAEPETEPEREPARASTKGKI